MLFPKLEALWGRLVLVSRNALHCPPRAGRRSTGLQRSLPRRPGAGRGAKRWPSQSASGRASGRRRSGQDASMVSARPLEPRGPVARGRAGRRRRSRSYAARLVSAILDAAAAAASASSSVFAVRCWFLRPERRGGETGACRRKRRKGVESVGDGAPGWKTETERGGEGVAAQPLPRPLPTRPGSACVPQNGAPPALAAMPAPRCA